MTRPQPTLLAHANSSRRRSPGFTLVEIAVAVFIIALLLGSLLIPLTTQVEQRQISDVQKTIEEIKESIIGFAVAKGHIPCPDKMTGTTTGPNDTPNDGIEDYNAAGNCIDLEGNLPWVTLGVAASDPWGNRFRYRVAGAFAQRTPLSTFTLTTVSTVEVCAVTGCGTRLTTSTDGPPAVIISHGKNGYGAIGVNTGIANTAPPITNIDELENTNGDTTYVYRIATAIGATASEFDDIVGWVSRPLLLNRMVAAGKLP